MRASRLLSGLRIYTWDLTFKNFQNHAVQAASRLTDYSGGVGPFFLEPRVRLFSSGHGRGIRAGGGGEFKVGGWTDDVSGWRPLRGSEGVGWDGGFERKRDRRGGEKGTVEVFVLFSFGERP